MMFKKFKCECCGEIFDEDECGSKKEYVGECWGAPAYEDWSACPECGSTSFEKYESGEEDD